MYRKIFQNRTSYVQDLIEKHSPFGILKFFKLFVNLINEILVVFGFQMRRSERHSDMKFQVISTAYSTINNEYLFPSTLAWFGFTFKIE